jgi:hypothetical protein
MDSSKIVKTVLLITIAVLFLVTSIISVVAGSRLVSETSKTYILGVESCEYKRVAVPLEEGSKPLQPEEKCKIDYNRAKGVLADSIAMLIISIPIALFTYRRLFKLYKE